MTNLNNIKNPTYFKTIKKLSFESFKKKIYQNKNQFIAELKNGKIFIVQNVLTGNVIDKIKNKTHKIGIKTPSRWHDCKYGAPNFHQIDDRLPFFKTTKCAHVFNFFNWNKDELEIFKIFDEILKLFNFINGNSEQIKKKLINRLQIHHYPRGAGFMDYHSDPDKLVKTLAILYMSEFGKDYYSGGLKLINYKLEKVFIDEKVKKGDMVFAYPTLEHGCDLIDADSKTKKINWDDSSGRWLFLLNTLNIKPINE